MINIPTFEVNREHADGYSCYRCLRMLEAMGLEVIEFKLAFQGSVEKLELASEFWRTEKGFHDCPLSQGLKLSLK